MKQISEEDFQFLKLEYYVKREGASEKDIRQEKKVLDDVAEKLENFKDFINSGCSGGC